MTLSQERNWLLDELAEANSPVIVMLGEEARRVLLGLADEADGRFFSSSGLQFPEAVSRGEARL